jgi:hypothetical protein
MYRDTPFRSLVDDQLVDLMYDLHFDKNTNVNLTQLFIQVMFLNLKKNFLGMPKLLYEVGIFPWSLVMRS